MSFGRRQRRTAHKPSARIQFQCGQRREVTHRRKRDVQLFRPRHTHKDGYAVSFSRFDFILQRRLQVEGQGHNLRADFRMQWKIDGNNTLDFRPRFSFSSRRSESMDTSFLRAGDALRSFVNSQESQRANKGTSFQANGELIFNHNFPSRPGRSFSVQLNYSFSNTRQYSTSLSELVYCLSKDDDEDLYRFMDSKQWNNTFGGRLTWTEPLGDVSKETSLPWHIR